MIIFDLLLTGRKALLAGRLRAIWKQFEKDTKKDTEKDTEKDTQKDSEKDKNIRKNDGISDVFSSQNAHFT